MKVSLSVSSTVMIIVCAALWVFVHPMVSTSPAVLVMGFNLSFPAILTGLSVLGFFAGLVGLMLETDKVIAARRLSRKLDDHPALSRRAVRR